MKLKPGDNRVADLATATVAMTDSGIAFDTQQPTTQPTVTRFTNKGETVALFDSESRTLFVYGPKNLNHWSRRRR